MSRYVEVPNLDDLIAEYLAGASEKEIAQKAGMDRRSIRKRLLARGIEPRGRAEAERVKWRLRKQRPDYREIVERQCRAAWDGATGRAHSVAERVERAAALGRKAHRYRIGRHERELAEMLERRGVGVSWQEPIGPHNADLAIREARVAVEIQREHWKPREGRACSVSPERIKDILDRDWHLLIVYAPPTKRVGPTGPAAFERFSEERVAEQIVAFAKRVRGLPPGSSQYGMIDGYGKPRAAPRLDFDGRARVPGF